MMWLHVHLMYHCMYFLCRRPCHCSTATKVLLSEVSSKWCGRRAAIAELSSEAWSLKHFCRKAPLLKCCRQKCRCQSARAKGASLQTSMRSTTPICQILMPVLPLTSSCQHCTNCWWLIKTYIMILPNGEILFFMLIQAAYTGIIPWWLCLYQNIGLVIIIQARDKGGLHHWRMYEHWVWSDLFTTPQMIHVFENLNSFNWCICLSILLLGGLFIPFSTAKCPEGAKNDLDGQGAQHPMDWLWQTMDQNCHQLMGLSLLNWSTSLVYLS